MPLVTFNVIHAVRGVVRLAFQMAVDDDLIRKNPFEFQLNTVVVNDSVIREAISRADEREFLSFADWPLAILILRIIVSM